MGYVYKIVGNFLDEDFNKMIAKISKHFVAIYVDSTLFISPKDYKSIILCREEIKKIFKPTRRFYIEEVTEKNISQLNPAAKEWCLNNLVRLDTEKFEIDNQERLQQVMISMDNMEKQLEQELLKRGESVE